MIIGTGIDIVEIRRVAELANRHERWKARLLTPREIAYLGAGSERRQAEFLAGRFAAKEAAAKALGVGIGRRLRLHDVEILPDPAGKPQLFIAEAMLRNLIADAASVRTHLSISHSRDFAVAQVLIERL